MKLSEEQQKVLKKNLSKEDYDLLISHYLAGSRENFCDELFFIIAETRYLDEEHDCLTEEGVQLNSILDDVRQSV